MTAQPVPHRDYGARTPDQRHRDETRRVVLSLHPRGDLPLSAEPTLREAAGRSARFGSASRGRLPPAPFARVPRASRWVRPCPPHAPRSWQSCRDVPVAWSLQGGEVAPAGLREPPLTAPEPLATVTPRFSASRVRHDHTRSRQGHQRSVPSTAASGTPPPVWLGAVLSMSKSIYNLSADGV